MIGHEPELWAIGLRNPWRFSFDRSTGDLYIGDVGYYLREEINVESPRDGGRNYGWSVYEGTLCQDSAGLNCETDGLTFPRVEYEHGLDRCAVIGGFVYRGTLHPGFQGRYFYGDYCSGQIWSLDMTDANSEPRQVFDADFMISGFAEDAAGELYVISLSQGAVYWLTPT
jgi:glucose/arabinose dehydrogenase